MSHQLEIERKFLIADDDWPRGRSVELRQGYLTEAGALTVRVRRAPTRAWLTLKAARDALTSDEFEYSVPVDEADAMLERLAVGSIVEKTRHRVTHAGKLWEIDVFAAANAGLVTAEIELESADARFERPPWLGREVTGDRRFHNASLAQRPFSAWEAHERDGGV